MKYIMLVDVEGVTGVTNYQQAETSEFGIRMLMNDIKAVLDGILSIPGNSVLIYEEHTDGCNIRLEELPAEVSVVRGKPLVEGAWAGIDASFDGLIMVGFHARAQETGALLPHSYVRWNRNISVNGITVGEIGMEAALAGENGVPLVLVTGDSAGVKEAEALVPGVVTVTVKEAIGEYEALCYPPARTGQMLKQAGEMVGRQVPPTAPLVFGKPAVLKVELEEGAFLDRVRDWYPERLDGATVEIREDTLTAAWTRYLHMERRIIRAL